MFTLKFADMSEVYYTNILTTKRKGIKLHVTLWGILKKGDKVAPMVKNELEALWRKKELEIGRIITIQEVAKATELNWETVAKLKSGQTTRYDTDVMAKICYFFGVREGEPVPFLVYTQAT